MEINKCPKIHVFFTTKCCEWNALTKLCFVKHLFQNYSTVFNTSKSIKPLKNWCHFERNESRFCTYFVHYHLENVGFLHSFFFCYNKIIEAFVFNQRFCDYFYFFCVCAIAIIIIINFFSFAFVWFSLKTLIAYNCVGWMFRVYVYAHFFYYFLDWKMPHRDDIGIIHWKWTHFDKMIYLFRVCNAYSWMSEKKR